MVGDANCEIQEAAELKRETIQPAGLARPSGYSYGVVTDGGRLLHLAGQTGMDASGRIVHPGDIVAQFGLALENLKLVVVAAGGEMSAIVKLTIFVTDKVAYRDNLERVGVRYRSVMGNHYPAMTLVEVKSLFDDAALVEIEGVAVLDK